jgi:hypothetical protein
MTFDYESWLAKAQARLETLYQQKSAIESEIYKLEKGIKGFAPLVNQPALWHGPDLGITDAVKAVFKKEESRLYSAVEIRNQLLEAGVALTQKNPLSTIYQVLSRLAEQGAILPYDKEGRTLYKWVVGWEAKKYLREEPKPVQKLGTHKLAGKR